ncbi:MAG TPA: creatininase family protein, partial [Abditibacteriaceae bacterium]|nr:creatininase family protein [Abditibacteriaceae bacterium]
QHGLHLAVSTDTALVTAIAEQVEAALAGDIVLCPTQVYGSSHHHLGFKGTMSIGFETYIRVLVDLVESLLSAGFRRIVLLNGHGGNITPGRQALTMLSHSHDDTLQPNIALATYWEMDAPAFSGEPPMESGALSHACEYETSMMLHLYPERVHLDWIQAARRPPKNGYIPWQIDEPYRGVTMSKRTHFVASTGASGQPELATPEKGAHLISKAVAATTEFLHHFKTWPLMPDLRDETNTSDANTSKDTP